MERGDNNVMGSELRQFIERLESLDDERREIGEQIKEVFSEMKGRGYLVMPVRQILKERRKNPDDLAEERAILAVYREALGME